MARGDFEEEDAMGDGPEQEDDDELEGDLVLDDIEEDETNWDMHIARVYDKTLVELGDTMSGPVIGIRTEPG